MVAELGVGAFELVFGDASGDGAGSDGLRPMPVESGGGPPYRDREPG